MKKTYVGTVTGNRYPFNVKVEASSWTTAVGRAAREWAKAQGKGSHTDRLIVALHVIRPLDWSKVGEEGEEPVKRPKRRSRVKRGLLSLGARR